MDQHPLTHTAESDTPDLQRQVASHIDCCRLRISDFIDTNYAWPGAFALNRLAWGSDIIKAPFNFIMGFPNFLLRILAITLEFMGARNASHRLLKLHLGFPTRVQRVLTEKLLSDLLDLRLEQQDTDTPARRLIADAAREPIKIYVQTRNVAADLTAGSLSALLGLVLFHQFTPGSISTGSVLAHLFAKEQAISEFAFGETLGRIYYDVFPVDPSLAVILVTLLLVMSLLAIVAAFSGMLHDPVQARTGTHRRRLNQLLDAIEASALHDINNAYRPKDTFFGRIYDLVDWIKGLLSF